MSRALSIVGILVLAIYLSTFVNRGWVPHDEGFLGQTAERAMSGEIPRLDFDEAYTGGLTYLHAAIFWALGVNVVNLRWALFCGAVAAAIVFWRIARRSGTPVEATAITIVATVWAFPNYFAAIPSWWNLVFAAGSLLALLCAVENQNPRAVVLAGALCGVSFLFKQAALYALIACALALLYAEQSRCALKRTTWRDGGLLLRVNTGVAALLLVAVIAGRELDVSTAVQLLLPAVVIVGVLVADAARRDLPPVGGTAKLLVLLGAGFAAPLVVFLLPLICAGVAAEFVREWWTLSRRFTAHVVVKPQGLDLLLLGVPLVLGSIVLMRQKMTTAAFMISSVVAVASVVVYANAFIYQMFWQSARLISIAGPLAAAYVLWKTPSDKGAMSCRLFALASMVAFWTLVQFPFSVPIYFFYVAPLSWLLGHALATVWRAEKRPLMVVATMYVLFAVVSTNRSELGFLGWWHSPAALDTKLDNARGPLLLSARDARVYDRVNTLIRQHARGAYIYATPDCPEIYFLSGMKNPTPVLFEFLSGHGYEAVIRDVHENGVSLIVINRRPDFSGEIDKRMKAFLTQSFPRSEDVGDFQVRWRPSGPGQTRDATSREAQ